MELVSLPQNYQFKNLAGKRYEMLQVLCYAGCNKRKKTRWLCKCDCGNLAIISNSDLKGGKTSSCGCLKEHVLLYAKVTHGLTYSPTYKSWSSMIQRATNKNLPCAGNYSLRGITVCDEWRKFENFYADMGERPSLSYSIDRINVDGNYEPGNCRWATTTEQAFNKRKRKGL